jgi:hypothetical protein
MYSNQRPSHMSLVGKFGLLLPNGARARIAQHWHFVTAGNVQTYILRRVLERITALMALGYDGGTWSINQPKRAMARRNNGELQF